jgi:Arc/MetJ family transcription regulator
MRTTIVLNDDLLIRARKFVGTQEMSILMNEALQALIEREGSRRLARLGGTEPLLGKPRPRRPRPN